MPGSLTTPGCPSTRVDVLDHVAFRYLYSVGTQDIPIAAQWLACAIPLPTHHRWPRGHRCTTFQPPSSMSATRSRLAA